ncbi:galactose-1-phosphate uridylyltransferase, partial [Candidatus Pacearchaeota archaeon]
MDNKFPSLSLEVDYWSKEEDQLYKSKSAYGKCEVLVYSADHNIKFHELKVDEILSIFEKWIEATKQLKEDKKIKYILPFENFGKDVGASILHPHGQIYAFSFVPHTVQNELRKIEDFFKKENACMICKYLEIEKKTDLRVVFENEFVIAVVPFSAQYAYDLYIYPKRCYSQLEESRQEELVSFANLLPKLVKSLFVIFGKEVSYSLSLHQKVFNFPESPNIYHMY